MIINEIITKSEWRVNRCSVCGKFLTNPGYNKQYKSCCGELQRWGDYYDVRYRVVGDTGRDERGRFSGKKNIKYERVK